MTKDQIRGIVKITIEELSAANMIKDPYNVIHEKVRKKLYQFFNNKGDGNGISYALNCLSDDPYISIIYMQYRDNKTIEFIAGAMDKDVSTIKRNKKRLILKIHEMID